jgi:hypothetical protein
MGSACRPAGYRLRSAPTLGPALARRADHQVRLEDDLTVPVRAVTEGLFDEQLGRGPA